MFSGREGCCGSCLGHGWVRTAHVHSIFKTVASVAAAVHGGFCGTEKNVWELSMTEGGFPYENIPHDTDAVAVTLYLANVNSGS